MIRVQKVIKKAHQNRETIREHSESFNKELQNRKKNQTELENTITKIQNTLEGNNSRLNDTGKMYKEPGRQNSRNHPVGPEKRKKQF